VHTSQRQVNLLLRVTSVGKWSIGIWCHLSW